MVDAHQTDSRGNAGEIGNASTSAALFPPGKMSPHRQYSDGERWNLASHRERCRIVAQTAREIAAAADALVHACRSDQRTDDVETIAGELVPLADALRWIGKRGASVLAPRRLPLWGRPLWLWGVRSQVQRDPLGKVLILGTWNYPLLLSGTQIAQALAAGNTVLLKPALGSEAASGELVDCFYRAGVPRDCLTLLDSSTDAATRAMDEGVDLVVLTGGAATGRKVLARAAQSLTPCLMELSGCDAVVVLDGADLDLLARAIRFGLSFNAGATCIGPRRLIVDATQADTILNDILRPWRTDQAPTMIVHAAVRASLAELLERSIAGGARDVLGRFDASELRSTGRMRPLVLDGISSTDEVANSDLFAPVLSVIRVRAIDSAEGHLAVTQMVNECPYRLAASVFGRSAAARRFASRLQVGSVVINDLIAPTADPRLPFGGRGNSGFGVTRGPEGLLAMTAARTVSERRSRLAPHLSQRRPADAETLLGSLQIIHSGSLSRRLAGLRRLITAVKTGWR